MIKQRDERDQAKKTESGGVEDLNLTSKNLQAFGYNVNWIEIKYQLHDGLPPPRMIFEK